MSTHYVVIESATGANNESAVIEASSLEGGSVSIAVRSPSGELASSFVVESNPDRFATSASHTADLLSLTNHQTALVVVTATQDVSVHLRHKVTSPAGTLTRSVAVPKVRDARAHTLIFPTGAVETGAHAIVINPNAGAIEVFLRYSTPNTSPVSTTAIRPNGFAFIPITHGDANAILTCSSDFLAQYLVGLGGNPSTEVYVLPS